MDPSPEDLSAGQMAYQGLRAYQRFKTSQKSKLSLFLSVVTALGIGLQILVDGFADKFWMAIGSAVALIILVWGLRRMEINKQKNFELLKQLKAKYGPEIYDALKSESDSMKYKFFQKSYLPECQASSIELP